MTAVLVLGIGMNYAVIFHQAVEGYLPFVAVGLVIWSFLSVSISEGGEAFVAGGAMLRQSSLPLPMFIFRTLIRNSINLAHQVVIIIAVLLWFHVYPGPGMLWAGLGLVLIIVNLGWIALVLAMISARFRDVPQIVSAMLQIAFFLSPIFWQPPPKLINSPLVTLNPLYFLIQSIREPLLHGVMPVQSATFLLPMAVVGWIGAILIYNQTRRRVVHYL
jgi:ABC-type polysaccharide/polyol phosphate export permease